MDNATFPPVLKNLIDFVNAEGRLQTWRLNSTLESYCLTIEWKKLSPRQEKGDLRNAQACCHSNDQETPKILKAETFTQKNPATKIDSYKNDLQESKDNILAKTNERSDFQTRFLQNSKKDRESFGKDTEFDDHRRSESGKSTRMENKVKYETQVRTKERRKSMTSQWKTQVYKENVNRETFNLSPDKAKEDQTSHGNNAIAGTNSTCFQSKQVGHGRIVTCACGETFTSRHLPISHLLFHCPVSLCFRTELECNIQREIDSWHGDEKIIGKAWWQGFKRNGFPDVLLELKDKKVERLSALVNSFIERASSQTLKDQNGNLFVLMAGLKELLY